MKTIVMIFCLVAIGNAIPANKKVSASSASNFDSNGPQPVDEAISIPNGGEENTLKRVARHYGYGGITVLAVPGYGGYGYGGYPYYGGGYGGYGGGYGGYGGGWGYGGGYGRGWGRGRGWGHHHHHHW